eukprot:2010452-Rhodomonas_salina.2
MERRLKPSHGRGAAEQSVPVRAHGRWRVRALYIESGVRRSAHLETRACETGLGKATASLRRVVPPTPSRPLIRNFWGETASLRAQSELQEVFSHRDRHGD